MNTIDRRDFLAQSAALAGTALLPFSNSARAEAPPEVNKIRLVHTPGICLSPQYLAEEFLRLEGFSEIEYVESPTTFPANFVASGQADFTQDGVTSLLPLLDAGKPLVALSGVHSGCYELFGNGHVKSVADLRGKTIAIPEFGSSEHTFMASILGYIGIDPRKEVKWVKGATGMDAMTLFMDGKADAILGFAPQPRDLRAKKIGHVILNTTQDRPWSQYFCCVVVARREFVAQNPIATRRALRAFLKSADVCSNEPERRCQDAGRQRVRTALRRRARGAKRTSLQPLAASQSRRHATLPCAAPSRSRHDQILAAEANCAGHQLALLERIKERIKGVTIWL